MKKIIANFDTIDLATFAVNKIKSRDLGITSVKVSYQFHDSTDEKVFSNFFIPSNLQNGVILNQALPYPVNYNALNEKEQDFNDYNPTHVKVELLTTRTNTRSITTTLRTYGAHNVKIIEN